MYKEIENMYKSVTKDKSYYTILGVSYIMLLIVIFAFKDNISNVVGAYIFIFSIINYIAILKITDAKLLSNPFKMFQKYKEYYNNIRKNQIIKFLKEKNLFKKENLKEMIEYYRSKAPIKIKNGLIESILSVVTIGIIFINPNTGKINEKIFANGILTIISIFILLLIGKFIISTLVSGFEYNFNLHNVDSELEKILSEIYLEIDNENIKKTKKKKK